MAFTLPPFPQEHEWPKTWPGRKAEAPKPVPKCSDMTMRQYYAAHAPAVPDWFRLEREGSMPAVRPTPDSFSDDERAQLVLLYNGTLRKDAASVEVVDFWMAQSQEKFALDTWRNKMREKKFFAWRWHYADMMIESENGQ